MHSWCEWSKAAGLNFPEWTQRLAKMVRAALCQHLRKQAGLVAVHQKHQSWWQLLLPSQLQVLISVGGCFLTECSKQHHACDASPNPSSNRALIMSPVIHLFDTEENYKRQIVCEVRMGKGLAVWPTLTQPKQHTSAHKQANTHGC